MDSESDPISEYKSSLNDLSFNSKPLINMLTMLSEDYKDTKAPEIVKCIEQRLHSVSSDKKLPILYLLDSICKNVGNIYIKLFTQNIVSTFCHVFEKVDEKTRLSLYKLRQTWNTIFNPRKLYAIDVRIHSQLDPAWPITAPKPDDNKQLTSDNKNNIQSVVKSTLPQRPQQQPHQQQVHINPKFFNDTKQMTTALGLQPPIGSGPEAELAKQLIQKQNELLQLQKQKLELEMLKEKQKLAEHARALKEKELKLNQKEQQMLRPNSPNGKKIKKRKRSRSHRSRSPSPISQKSRSPTHRWSRSPTDRIRENPTTMNRQQSPSFSMRQTNSYSPHRQRSRSPNVINKQFIGQKSVVPLPTIQSSVPSLATGLLSTSVGVVGQPPVPTTIPAPTILAQPEMLSISNMKIARLDQSVVTTMSGMQSRPISSAMNQINAHTVHSGHRTNDIERDNSTLASWGQDRDYRKEFDLMISEAHEKLRSGAISSAAHDVLVREVERQLIESQNNSIQSLIPEPLDTFTMLVDGKLRKLFYLDDTTAVVLLNAPQDAKFDQLIKIDPKLLDPRQIGFEGKPTKVFIDIDRGCDEFVFLEFNGQLKTFFHGENSIAQRIKFGGPAKEIILNGQPYPAKFGGPPITVWFDGDTSRPHTLRLDGPTPRVKLSDERRFDLWDLIIQKATSGKKAVENATNALSVPQKPTDIEKLLSNLLAAGMIPKTNNNLQSINAPKEEQIEKKEEEKKASEEPPLRLTSDSLKLSRPSVIAALYNGIQCTNCSLRFDDKDQPFLGDKTRYSKHLDWHFRQNRRDKAKPNSSATSMRRNWYYPLALWCQFKEVTDEEESNTLFINEENESEVEEELPLATVIAEKDESLNCCAVCAEKFDQQWNEEEEEWRLKNAVSHNGKIYHPLCLTDFIVQNERADDLINEQELNESVSTSETKPNISEDNIKTELSQDINNSVENSMLTDKCDNVSAQELSVTLVNVNTIKSENNEMIELIDHEMSDSNAIPLSDNQIEENLNEEQLPSSDETKVEVIEFEIPLNDKEFKHNLSDILETEKVVTQVKEDSKSECSEEVQPSVVTNDKIVLQTGGIVIKMKASNLQQQTLSQPLTDQETTQTQEPEVTVRGHELSSLCNIM
jgi:hypothetical protein